MKTAGNELAQTGLTFTSLDAIASADRPKPFAVVAARVLCRLRGRASANSAVFKFSTRARAD